MTKKLKEVSWKKCNGFNELLECMINTTDVLVNKYRFYFNDQQHQIADINRTLKNHNDWQHRINCYYNGFNYYMVIFKADRINVIYSDNILNARGFGYIFLKKYRENMKTYNINDQSDLYEDPNTYYVIKKDGTKTYIF